MNTKSLKRMAHALCALLITGMGTVHGQLLTFEKKYEGPSGTRKTATYHLAKTLNNNFQHVGILEEFTVGGFSSGPLFNDMRIFRTDMDGAVLSNTVAVIGTPFDDRAFSACRADLGNMMVVGHVGQGFTAMERQTQGLPANTEDADVCLVKLNGNGGVVGMKTWDFGGSDDHAYCIVRKNSTSLYFVGRRFNTVKKKYEILFVNVDANGNIISSSVIHDQHATNLLPVKMIRTDDGGFLILASTDRNNSAGYDTPDPLGWYGRGSEVLLIKLNSSENLQWNLRVQFTDTPNPLLSPYDMVEDSQGDVALCGISSQGNWVMKVSPTGSVVARRRFVVGEGNQNVAPLCIIRAPEGFRLSGGTTQGIPSVVLSSSLIPVASRRHGTSSNEGILSLANTPTGDVFFGGASYESMLVKWPAVGATCDEADLPIETEEFGILQTGLVLSKEPCDPSPRSNPTVTSHNITNGYECYITSRMAQEPSTPTSLFPNPASSEVTITLPADGAVEVYDQQGRMVLKRQFGGGANTLPVGDLDNGVYIVRILSEGTATHHRLAVMH